MKKKGQALVEFILILPVLLFIIMGMIDIGNIILTKYSLVSELDVISNLYQNDKDAYNNYITKNKITLSLDKSDELTTLTISKKIKINTPLLSNVLKSPYLVQESMTIYEK